MQPRGVAVVIEAMHLCMIMRGVREAELRGRDLVHARRLPRPAADARGVPVPDPQDAQRPGLRARVAQAPALDGASAQPARRPAAARQARRPLRRQVVDGVDVAQRVEHAHAEAEDARPLGGRRAAPTACSRGSPGRAPAAGGRARSGSSRRRGSAPARRRGRPATRSASATCSRPHAGTSVPMIATRRAPAANADANARDMRSPRSPPLLRLQRLAGQPALDLRPRVLGREEEACARTRPAAARCGGSPPRRATRYRPAAPSSPERGGEPRLHRARPRRLDEHEQPVAHRAPRGRASQATTAQGPYSRARTHHDTCHVSPDRQSGIDQVGERDRPREEQRRRAVAQDEEGQEPQRVPGQDVGGQEQRRRRRRPAPRRPSPAASRRSPPPPARSSDRGRGHGRVLAAGHARAAAANSVSLNRQ